MVTLSALPTDEPRSRGLGQLMAPRTFHSRPRSARLLTLPKLQQHRPQESFSRLPRRPLLYSGPHSIQRCRGRRPWPGSRNWKGNHSWLSSVRSVQAAKPSSEVVVPKAGSVVGGGVSLDRLDRLLHMHRPSQGHSCKAPRRFFSCKMIPTCGNLSAR